MWGPEEETHESLRNQPGQASRAGLGGTGWPPDQATWQVRLGRRVLGLHQGEG